jgi:hypothetical protein
LARLKPCPSQSLAEPAQGVAKPAQGVAKPAQGVAEPAQGHLLDEQKSIARAQDDRDALAKAIAELVTKLFRETGSSVIHQRCTGEDGYEDWQTCQYISH